MNICDKYGRNTVLLLQKKQGGGYIGFKNTSSQGVVSMGTAEDGGGYSTTGYFPR